MFEDKMDDTFLARWINDELTPEELSAFQSHPNYKEYLKIKTGADALSLREFNIESTLDQIKASNKSPINSSQHTNKPVKKLWPIFAVAASILIIMGIFLFDTDNTVYNTGHGATYAFALPDGSEVQLNAKSSVTFKDKDWDKERVLELNGEAFFSVEKGSVFTVQTDQGEIKVLGTQFNVRSYENFFEVTCYEGKVKVIHRDRESILEAGDVYQQAFDEKEENLNVENTQPSWLSNTTTFKSVPIGIVFQKLEEQYDLNIKTDSVDKRQKFTGSFPNKDQEVALKTVFSTLGLSYKLIEENKTVVVE